MLVRFIVAANRIGSPRQQFTDFTGSHLHVILIDQPHFVIRRHRTPLRMHRYILRVIQPGIIHQAFRHPVYLPRRTSQHRFTRLVASALNLAPPTCKDLQIRQVIRTGLYSIQIKARAERPPSWLHPRRRSAETPPPDSRTGQGRLSSRIQRPQHARRAKRKVMGAGSTAK